MLRVFPVQEQLRSGSPQGRKIPARDVAATRSPRAPESWLRDIGPSGILPRGRAYYSPAVRAARAASTSFFKRVLGDSVSGFVSHLKPAFCADVTASLKIAV